MEQKSPYYTLITGSSMGIGKAMAYECARRKMNLVLVALEGSLLEDVRRSIMGQYPVDVITFAVDLTVEGAAQQVLDVCQAKGCRVNFLVNNAGLGAGGLFENLTFTTYERLMALNNRALVSMAHVFMPELLKNRPFHILNSSSIEATMPLPYKAVYTATKNFIYAFSLALREELRTRAGKVSVLCPGPVPTNEENMKRYISHGWRAKIIAKLPDEVARTAIRSTLRGKRVIVPGAVNRLVVLLMHILPLSVKMRILERLFRVYHDHKDTPAR